MIWSISQEALKTRMKQRNEAHALLASLSSLVLGQCPNILDFHRDELSPIRRLPPEIIRIIFLFWASDRHFFQSPTCVSPSVLTGVCVSWRNIAFGMPELWSLIVVEIRNGKFYPDKRTIEKWIKRSGSYALSSFSIEERDPLFHSNLTVRLGPVLRTLLYGDTNLDHSAESPVASMLNLFIPHHFRWQKILLRYKNAWNGKVGFASLPRNATYPLLEEVHLYENHSLWALEDVDRIKSMMISAPRLHSISWLSQKSYATLAFPDRKSVV